MFPNAKGSEQLSILAALDPGNQATGAANTGWVPLNTHHGLLALVQTGALATGSTVDAKLQQALDTSGSGAKDVSGKAITQLSQANNGANCQALINLRPEELDVNNGFAYVRLVVTVATAAANTSAQLLGINPRLASAETANQAAVAQIV
ncbi:MAG: hypothetical protein QM527_06575 [Alphaproteobacteria bacterium]|nr:hypothetical protein [Alphaproteobacteria bacterium]